MRRLVLALLLCLLPVGAHALNCPEVITDCPTMNANDANIGGKLKARSIVFLSAVDYGVKADAVIDQTTGAFISGTSDDTALRAALDDCAAKNATLQLPPRPILIDGTGGVTAMIQNCAVVGTAQRGGMYSEPKGGTLILLRSKTVAPFHIRSDWTMRGVAFYHPDQVGAGATFTGSVVGTALTTTAVTNFGAAGGIKTGYLVVGFGVPLGTHIVSQTGGTTGGAGTYTLDAGMPTRSNIAMSVSKPADQYPPVLSDDGTVGAGHFLIDDVTFVNSYDAIAGTPNKGWGAFFITHVHGWALRDMFRPGFIGDTFHLGPSQFSPGAWFGLTGQSTATKLALNWGSQQNSIFHVQSGGGLPWQVAAEQMGGESWRWAFNVDANNVSFTQSLINIAGDSISTVMKVPEGSSYYGFNGVIRGSAGCNVTDWVQGGFVGDTNCFEMSSTSSLILSDFLGYAQGDVVLTNGASVQINGGEFQAGGSHDGSDRAVVRLTANTGQVNVRNAFLFGVSCASDATQCHHVRGIDTGAFSASNLQVQNNIFLAFENSIKINTSAYTSITGNTDATIAGLSVLALGTGGAITWGGNTLEKPPLASVSACGGGATITGTLSGVIVVGSGTVTTCQLTVPFSPTGNVVSAWAEDGTGLSIIPSGGATAVIGGAAGADIHGKSIMFDWRGSK